MSSTPREDARLIADDADGMAVEPRESAHDVRRPPLVHLEELAAVDDAPDHIVHVVRLVRIVGNKSVELGILAVAEVGSDRAGHPLGVVLRQKREQVARVIEARLLVGGG